MIEVVAVVLLGGGAPGRRVRQAPVDRQRYADARAGEVPAANVTASLVMLVELEARGGDIAAARPRVNRIIEQANRRAIFVKGHITTDEIIGVGEPIGKAPRSGKQEQPRRFQRAASQYEHIRLLFDEIAIDVLVDRRHNGTVAIQREFAHIAFGAKITEAGPDRVRHKDVERAGSGSGGIAMLLRKGADNRGLSTVEGAR